MDKTTLDPNMPVDEIMRRWPATIRPLLHHRMLCVGCPIGVFHTVADACVEHGLNREAFEAALLEAIHRVAVAEPEAAASGLTAGCDQPPPGAAGPSVTLLLPPVLGDQHQSMGLGYDHFWRLLLIKRERIKRQTIAKRRLLHRRQAA